MWYMVGIRDTLEAAEKKGTGSLRGHIRAHLGSFSLGFAGAPSTLQIMLLFYAGDIVSPLPATVSRGPATEEALALVAQRLTVQLLQGQRKRCQQLEKRQPGEKQVLQLLMRAL